MVSELKLWDVELTWISVAKRRIEQTLNEADAMYGAPHWVGLKGWELIREEIEKMFGMKFFELEQTQLDMWIDLDHKNDV